MNRKDWSLTRPGNASTRFENWSTGDTYIATIGQGYVLSTPLQVLVSFATIANDGVMMKPTLVKEILSPDGEVIRSYHPDQGMGYHPG